MAMDKLPELGRLSEQEKAALITALWGRGTAVESPAGGHSKPNRTSRARTPTTRVFRPRRPRSPTICPVLAQGLVARPVSDVLAGVGHGIRIPTKSSSLKPRPARIVTGPVQAHQQHLHAVYDKIELPPIRPIVTRVEQHAGQCPHCGQSYVAPVPVGMEPGTPFGASIQSLVTYSALHPCDQLCAVVCPLHAGVWGLLSVKERWPTSSSGWTHSWTTA